MPELNAMPAEAGRNPQEAGSAQMPSPGCPAGRFVVAARRQVSYLFWVLAEQGLSTGVTRLVLFPLAAWIVGKDRFGVFVTAMSVAYMLGVTPAIGLSTGILRHLTQYPPEGQGNFCRTALDLCRWALVILIGLGLLAVAAVAGLRLTPGLLLACLVPLLISLYAENQFFLMLTEFYIGRHFRARTLWCGVQAGLQFTAGLLGTIVAGPAGLAGGYCLGSFAAFALLRARNRHWLAAHYDAGMAGVLKLVWLHMTLGSILAFSGQYLNRIVLSTWHSFASVSDLYAATSIMYVLLTPVSSSSNVLLGMLSRYQSISALPRGAILQCVLVALASVVGLPVVLLTVGPLALRVMFPAFHTTAAVLLPILVWAMPFAAIMLLARPFVLKFSPVKVSPIVNGIALAGYLISALALTPAYGARGAAWSLVIASAVHAAAMLGIPRLYPTSTAIVAEEPMESM